MRWRGGGDGWGEAEEEDDDDDEEEEDDVVVVVDMGGRTAPAFVLADLLLIPGDVTLSVCCSIGMVAFRLISVCFGDW